MTENNIAIFMQDNASCHTSKLTKGGWISKSFNHEMAGL